jgi:hypothetical protein
MEWHFDFHLYLCVSYIGTNPLVCFLNQLLCWEGYALMVHITRVQVDKREANPLVQDI